MKRKNKVIFTVAITLFIGMFATMGLMNNNYFNFPLVTNAEKTSETETIVNGQDFETINQLAKAYKANPSSTAARDLVGKIFDAISIIEVPANEKSQMLDQVAASHFNGSSNIPESNIVVAVNDLASRAEAPNFAYTDLAQVVITRKYLNRLVPDLVSANGGMTDIESFVVFTGLVSQKIDNEDFMVPPGQFMVDSTNVSGNEVPGRPERSGEVSVTQESAETNQMINAINSYVSSKRTLAGSEVITLIGIQ